MADIEILIVELIAEIKKLLEQLKKLELNTRGKGTT